PARAGHGRHAPLRGQRTVRELGGVARGRRRVPRHLRRVPRGVRRAAHAGRYTVSYLPYAVAGWICLVGLYGIVTSRDLVHLALCLSVTQSSTYVLLLAVGYVEGGGPPIFKGVPLGTSAVDPVVQS